VLFKKNAMSILATQFHQEVVSDNKEIFEKLHLNLNSASTEILVATAWFTDEILFEALIQGAKRGVSVKLIIADNAENQKLNFQQLVEAGGELLRIKNVGYGIMHQKFCVIDKKIALHGTYNWTNNAKNNNHESIIITTHQETVSSLMQTFFDIKERGEKILRGESLESSVDSPVKQSIENINTNSMPEKTSTQEFTEAVEAIIAAETSSFDRTGLRQQGFDRAMATNGDPQMLVTALDSVYSVFVEEITVGEEKKKKLLGKIEELKVKAIAGISEKNQLQIHTIENHISTAASGLKIKLSNLETLNSLDAKEIQKIREVNLVDNSKKIEDFASQIRKHEVDCTKPEWKLYEVIPVWFFLACLTFYILLFYSSAAYILLFAEQDAKEALNNGEPIISTQVFNPQAISLVWNKEGSAFLYIFLFVIIPLGLSSIKLFTNSKAWQWTTLIFGVLVVDSFIAVKVAESVAKIEFLRGTTDVAFQLDKVFYDLNFYLVFILGAFGLVLYKFVFEKLIIMFDDRNVDIIAQRKKVEIGQLNTMITSLRNDEQTMKESIISLEKKMLQQKGDILQYQLEANDLPDKKATTIEKFEHDSKSKVEEIERVSDVFLTRIQNNNVFVHVDSIKDRINIYLEGWSDFLNKEYSVARASEKYKRAFDAASEWQREKLTKTNIDSRIAI
jgi:hypothetical protein